MISFSRSVSQTFSRITEKESNPCHFFSRDKQVKSQLRLSPIKRAMFLQGKLNISQPDDVCEQEADQVAEMVMRMPEPEVQRQVESEEEKIELDEESAQGKDVSSVIYDVPLSVADSIQSLQGGGKPLHHSIRTFFESRFDLDFNGVRVHTDAKAAESAQAMNALAYTVGQDIVFGPGQFSPHSFAGQRLLAHELVHTVQSGRSPANKLIRRRRVPSPAKLAELPLVPAELARSKAGLARVISRAWAALSAEQRQAVRMTVSTSGIIWTTEEELLSKLSSATRTQLLSFAQAILMVEPRAELGDPNLIKTGPRPGTNDAANIATLTNKADEVFEEITSGSRNNDLKEVFGTSNVAIAKTRYRKARRRLKFLRDHNKIFSDQSGYAEEVHTGGSASGSEEIWLPAWVVNHPTNEKAVINVIHESMHAGNSGVVGDEGGYKQQPFFKKVSARMKLKNAAHYEVIPYRILLSGSDYAFLDQTFVPAGTTRGGRTAPTLNPREKAIDNATNTFRLAWNAALTLHSLYVRLFLNPTAWNTLDLRRQPEYPGAGVGSRFKNTLPYWSKVEMLTIHTRLPNISPTGTPANRPVTLIDIALSEGLARKMSFGILKVPQNEADALVLEAAYATPAERTVAASSIDNERNLLIKLILRTELGNITGTVGRDERVIERLAQAKNWSDFLKVRTPGDFID